MGYAGKQVEQSEVEVRPDNAPQQRTRMEQRPARSSEKPGITASRTIADNPAMTRFTSGPATAIRMSRFQAVDRIGNGMRFVEDGDSADWQQDDALRRNARTASHQSVTEFVQDHAAEDDAHQSRARAGRRWHPAQRLRCSTRKPAETGRSDECEFRFRKDVRPGWTNCASTCLPSILSALDTDSRCRVAKGKAEGLGRRGYLQ